MVQLPTRQQIKDRRKTESPIEASLLREFHLLGYYPKPQYWIGKYRIDLAFEKERLAIECDGKDWHSSESQKENDRQKDEFLKGHGWKVLRIKGSDIFRRADEIVKVLIGLEVREKKKKDGFIKIDYELNNPEDIEEKEQIVKNEIEEQENKKIEEFQKVGNLIGERYKNSI